MKRKKKPKTPEHVLESLQRWIDVNERSIAYVSRLMDLRNETLWRWLNNKRKPSPEVVASIAEWLEEN